MNQILTKKINMVDLFINIIIFLQIVMMMKKN